MSNYNEEDLAIWKGECPDTTTKEIAEVTFSLIEDVLVEWDELINELSEKEIQLYVLKEAYESSSEKLLEEAAKKKIETGEDIIKAKYGGNNDKTRAKYVKEMLLEDAIEIKGLEFSIDYIVRRIAFLKGLVYVKISLGEKDE